MAKRYVIFALVIVLLFCCTSCTQRTAALNDNSSNDALSDVAPSDIATSDTAPSDGTQVPSESDGEAESQANFAASSRTANDTGTAVSEPDAVFTASNSTEVRGMWIAFFELYPMFDVGKDFREEFAKVLDNCVESGINSVYVHVRSHCDAFYDSEIFPWSKYVNGVDGTQGRAPEFDPLEVMIALAHERGLEFHAWINHYRVLKDSTDLSLLSDDNPAKIWLTDSDDSNDLCVTECKGGLYLNPAEPQVQRLIADGVREIVKNYDVDGIHFDDYFYPTTDESFDEAHYAAYRASVSSNPLPLADWRRANVNAMVGAVYNAVKSEKPTCIFGISPMASIRNNYNTVYADIAAWLELGVVDYIMPQLYFGFEYPDEKSRYDTLLREWCELIAGKPQQLLIGLGSYRVGSTDSYHAEWSEHDDVLARQIEMLRADGVSDGFVIYSYTTFFKEDELSTAVRASVRNLTCRNSGD